MALTLGTALVALAQIQFIYVIPWQSIGVTDKQTAAIQLPDTLQLKIYNEILQWWWLGQFSN